MDDPAYVRGQYATETGLAARKAVYRDVTGGDPRDVAFRMVADAGPRDVLEVGCGEGELAARMAAELDASVVALDQSPRMVEITRGRGVTAVVGDAQELPFEDESFDAVVAAWMLYHVPDLDRTLREIGRVLRPGGLLVAITNGPDHLDELYALTGADNTNASLPFGAENAAEILARHFAAVDETTIDGTVTFATIELVRSYYASSDRHEHHVDALPPQLDEPLVVKRRSVVLAARRAAR